MKTISAAYYEKMAEARKTFCAFCMRGSMPFLEDCEDCKVNRMFKAVQAVIKEETTPQDEAAVEKTRNAYDGIDLPKEMIESLGKGPRNHDGFRTSPAFQLFITNGAYPDVEVQLIESKTGFPDFSGSEEEASSRSTVYYLNYLEKGVGVPSSIQLWDLTYDALKDELKSSLERMFNRSINQFWGIQALPFPERYFITSRSAEELAADMISEVGNCQASDADEYGCAYSQEHYVGCPRNSNITPQGQNVSGEVYMRLGKFSLRDAEKSFIETRCTISPMFVDTRLVKEMTEYSVAAKVDSIICYIAAREEGKAQATEKMAKDTNQN